MNYSTWSYIFYIFSQYDDTRYGVDAEHNTIYLSKIPPDQMQQVHLNALSDFGFRWDEDIERWAKHV